MTTGRQEGGEINEEIGEDRSVGKVSQLELGIRKEVRQCVRNEGKR